MSLVKNQNIQTIFIVLINTCNKGFTAALYKIIETIEDMPGSRIKLSSATGHKRKASDTHRKPNKHLGQRPSATKFSGSAHGQLSGTYSIGGGRGGGGRERIFCLEFTYAKFNFGGVLHFHGSKL